MIDLPPGGILLGLGCDLIEVERIRGVMERQGERFLNRVFTAEERAYCDGMKHPHKHYAARFAAKEAVSKCFTTGIGAGGRGQGLTLDKRASIRLRSRAWLAN